MRIRELRINVGLTQKELAQMLGVKRATVSMWETAASTPQTSILPRLAKIFGCTIDELFEAGRCEIKPQARADIESAPTDGGAA